MGVIALFWARSDGKARNGECFSVVDDTIGVSDSDLKADHCYAIHYPDLSLSKARQFLETEFRTAVGVEPNVTAHDASDRYTELSKRKWRLKTENLPLSTSKLNKIYKRDLDLLVENKRDDGDFLKISAVVRG